MRRPPRRGQRLGVALAIVGLAIAGAPGAARAYTRMRTSTGNPAAWRTPHVVIHVPLLTPERPVGALSSEEVFAATVAAGSIWSRAQVDCTAADLSTVVADASRDALVGNDKQNNVIFRDDSWEAKTFDKDGNPIGDYEPNQLALTSVSVKGSGEIVDADVEINAFNHPAWEVSGDMSQLVADGAVDLQNTLSHELGHVLGFDHSCWNPATGPRPLDGDVPLTACADDPALAEATMAPTAPPGDVAKRVLHADDRRGVCDVYPVDAGGGCALAGGGPATNGRAYMTFAALTTLLALAMSRRRRQRC